MKLRITRKNLEELTFEQRQNLCDLWIPHIFDAAIATVCVDAMEEKYEQIAFVIGSIKLLKHNDMLLHDLKFSPDEPFRFSMDAPATDNPAEGEDMAESDQSPDADVNEIEAEEDTAAEMDIDLSLDEDFSFEFQRPESYMKHDCMPLLDIGQMIDILQRKNYGNCDFSLSVTVGDFVCDMGRDAFSGSNYDVNNKNSELCDILWEAVKALL